MVQELVTRYRDDEDTCVAYFYLNFRRQHEQKVEDLLASLPKRLGQCQSSLPDQLKTIHEEHTHRDSQTRPSLHNMSKALQCVASLFSRVFIVVDALDECGDSDGSRTQFLSELANLQANSGAKLFATLRHIPDIIQKFDRSDTLEIRASDEDIRAYLGGRASELPKCVGRTPGLQDEIKNGILQAADGMYVAPHTLDALCSLDF